MSLKELIESIPLDKLRHLALGVVYSISIPVLALVFGKYGAALAFLIATLLVIWKELYHDLHEKKGNAELLDFIYNEIPIAIVYLTYLL